MRVALHLSGQHPEAPFDEAVAAFEAEGAPARFARPHERMGIVESDAEPEAIARTVGRLGLTRSAGLVIGQVAFDEATIDAEVSLDVDDEGSVCVRAKRLSTDAPWRSSRVEKALGKALARPVDLEEPDHVVNAFLLADHILVSRRIHRWDAAGAAARHVKNRPYFSPVSLDPRWARALINLARARGDGVLVDPFCGTGGILLEAASMGLPVAGSDLDPAMIAGTRRNLAAFGHQALALVAADVADAPAALAQRGVTKAQSIVTDLPYGRSSSTGREALEALLGRAATAWPSLLKTGSRVVAGVGDPASARHVAGSLDLEASYDVRVHRSLTRRFVVLS